MAKTEKAQINISFFKGVDTKTDDKLLGETFSRLENVEFGFPQGSLSKRAGYSQIQSTGLSASVFDKAVVGLATQKDNLLALESDRVLAYDEVSQAWNPQSKIGGLNVSLETKNIIRNDYDQTKASIAYNSEMEPTLMFSAWEDSRGGIRYQIMNISGTIIVPDTLMATSGSFTKTFYLDSGNGYWWTTYARSGAIYGKYLDASTNTLSTEVSLLASLNATNNLYDVEVVSTRFNIAADTGPGTIRVRSFGPTGIYLGIESTWSLANSRAMSLRYHSITGSNFLALAYASTTGSELITYNASSLAQIMGPITLNSNLDGFTQNITTTVRSGTNQIEIYYDRLAPNINISGNVCLQIADTDGAVSLAASTPYQIQRNCALAGDPVNLHGITYLPVVHESITRTTAPLIAPSVQSTWFLLQMSASAIPTPIVAAKAFYSEAGRAQSTHTIPNSYLLTLGGKPVFATSATRKGELKTNISGASYYTPFGVVEMRADLDSVPQSVEVNGGTYFDGGIVSYYDGARMSEVGFHLAPDAITSSGPSAGSGGFNGVGTYGYRVTYESVDNGGRNTISGYSIPYFLKYTTTFSNSLVINNAHLSNRPTGSIVQRIWRTKRNDTIYRLLTERTSIGDGDINGYTDTVPDYELDDNQLLNDVELSNISPPASHAIATHKNRVFVAVSDHETDIWYSKINVPTLPVEWGEGQIITCPAEGGRITGLASIGGQLAIFKSDRIYLVEGEGPTADGQGGQYYPPQLLTSADVGCINKHSIVYCPQGVMFQSRRGIMLLGNDFSLVYVGANVESYTTGSVSSAILSPETNTVRFTLTGSGSPMLVYDYSYGFWNVYSDKGARHSVRLSPSKGKTSHVLLDTFGRDTARQNLSVPVYEDTMGAVSSSYASSFTTGWISLAQINGFQRIQEVAFLGRIRSAARVQVRVFYDFNEAQEDAGADTYTINVSDFSSDNTMFRIPMRKQVCSSIRFSVQEIAQSSSSPPSGQGLEMTGMSIIYRGLVGHNKTPWRGN